MSETKTTQAQIEMFRVRHSYGFKFEKVIVDRESAQFIWLGQNRLAKISLDTRYFSSFEAARIYALSYQRNQEQIAEEKLRHSKESIRDIIGLTPETIKTSTDRW